MLYDINDTERVKRTILEEDRTIRLWDFTTPGLSRKKRDFDFSSGDFKLSVIDPFNGVLNPHLTSYETLVGGYLPRLVPTVILDSNVMSNLHIFTTKPEALNDNQRKVITNLLDYLILEKVDYNPSFYYLEAFSKAKSADDERHVRGFAQSMLTLHTMDELHFLTRREIKVDPETLEKYRYRYGASTLDEMVSKVIEGLKEMLPSSNTDWQVLYIILLKSALIHKTYNGDLVSKMRKLNDFIYKIFGVLFSRELSIASFYFSGKLNNFIPFQKGAIFSNAITKFRASAWDIYLLRFPELLLSTSLEPIPLAVICTGDKSAQYIGRKFRINKLYSNKDTFYPELLFDYSDIEEQEGIIAELFKEYADNRVNKRMNYDVDEVLRNLPTTINELENEIKELCA